MASLDKWAIAYILNRLEDATSDQMDQEEFLEGSDLLPDYPDEEYEPIAAEFMFLVEDYVKQIQIMADQITREMK